MLAIGTANGEFTLSAARISDPVTPANVEIAPQTTFGSAGMSSPCAWAPVILFLRARRPASCAVRATSSTPTRSSRPA